MGLPQSRLSRRFSAGFFLIAAPFAAVMAARGVRRPWIPNAPPYRQEGPADAKAVLVEYSDFECPGCGASVGAVKNIRGLYGPNLRVIFKHFPWSFHPWAKKAAVAAECAGRQAKFWEMHDLLFEHQRDWPQDGSQRQKADDLIGGFADQLRLDRTQFQACLKDPAAAASVEADAKEGQDHWVRSTPTFFINGRRFVGTIQLRTLGVNHIERILKKS